MTNQSPESNQPPTSTDSSKSHSRALFYGVGIMLFLMFLIACWFSTPFGDFGRGADDSLSEDDIRRIADEAIGTQLAAAPLGETSGETVNSVQLQQLVDDAVGTQVAALIPSNTPIPPTPTIIPVGVAEDDDAFLGPDDAPVVIVEFSDFQCGFCGRWYAETLPNILETYPDEVKFVYRDFPIFGEESLLAAAATECAEEQDQAKFWEMHNRLFERLNDHEEATLNHETLVTYAGELDLDTISFSECLSSERYTDEILNDFRAAEGYGLRGTPGFVINGVVYPIGAQPFDVFEGIIQSELARINGDQ